MITILCIAAVWRLTYMLQNETGPWHIIERVRNLFIRPSGEARGMLGELLQCYFCLSIWVAAPFAIYLSGGIYQFFIYWFALSAGAIVLNLIVEKLES